MSTPINTSDKQDVLGVQPDGTLIHTQEDLQKFLGATDSTETTETTETKETTPTESKDTTDTPETTETTETKESEESILNLDGEEPEEEASDNKDDKEDKEPTEITIDGETYPVDEVKEAVKSKSAYDKKSRALQQKIKAQQEAKPPEESESYTKYLENQLAAFLQQAESAYTPYNENDFERELQELTTAGKNTAALFDKRRRHNETVENAKRELTQYKQKMLMDINVLKKATEQEEVKFESTGNVTKDVTTYASSLWDGTDGTMHLDYLLDKNKAIDAWNTMALFLREEYGTIGWTNKQINDFLTTELTPERRMEIIPVLDAAMQWKNNKDTKPEKKTDLVNSKKTGSSSVKAEDYTNWSREDRRKLAVKLKMSDRDRATFENFGDKELVQRYK